MSGKPNNSSEANKKKGRRSSMIDKIPVMGIAGARRNKNLVKLKQDLEERARAAAASESGPTIETMYIDKTRNVGVVLGIYRHPHVIGYDHIT